MSNVAIGTVYQVRNYAYDNPLTQVLINTWYLRIISLAGPGVLSEENFCGGIDADLAPLYKAFMPATAEYYGLSIQAWNLGTPRPVPIVSNANTGPGVAAGNALPLQTSALIQLKTAYAGGSYRGRMYPGFHAASSNDVNGAMNAGGFALIAPLGAYFIGTKTVTFGANSANFVVVVRGQVQILPLPADKTEVFTPVTTTSVPQKWATQRRRGQFGRINALPF